MTSHDLPGENTSEYSQWHKVQRCYSWSDNQGEVIIITTDYHGIVQHIKVGVKGQPLILDGELFNKVGVVMYDLVNIIIWMCHVILLLLLYNIGYIYSVNLLLLLYTCVMWSCYYCYTYHMQVKTEDVYWTLENRKLIVVSLDKVPVTMVMYMLLLSCLVTYWFTQCSMYLLMAPD